MYHRYALKRSLLSKSTRWLPHQTMPRSPVQMTAFLSWLKCMTPFCHHNASHMLMWCLPRLQFRVPVLLVLAQDTSLPARRPISSDLLLLDSQSTVHLFSQTEHVSNIRPATNPIKVHCNKGTMDTTQEADFGDTPVYFDARGIANVLSLYQLGQKFKVTYDSTDRGGVFKVFASGGGRIQAYSKRPSCS